MSPLAYLAPSCRVLPTGRRPFPEQQILKALTGCDRGSKSFDLSIFNVSLTEICFKKLFTKIQLASTVGQASCPCWCVSKEPTAETTVLMLHLQPVPCLL